MVDTCPICQQNFKISNPQRNYLAERLVQQHFVEREQSLQDKANKGEDIEGWLKQYLGNKSNSMFAFPNFNNCLMLGFLYNKVSLLNPRNC